LIDVDVANVVLAAAAPVPVAVVVIDVTVVFGLEADPVFEGEARFDVVVVPWEPERVMVRSAVSKTPGLMGITLPWGLTVLVAGILATTVLKVMLKLWIQDIVGRGVESRVGMFDPASFRYLTDASLLTDKENTLDIPVIWHKQ
jgi:hypothetical protein